MLKIRLSRCGSKKRPCYRVVVADVRSPRDGGFIDRIGTYNPLFDKTHVARVLIDAKRAEYWLSVGAIPTDRVARFLDTKGLIVRPSRCNPIKGRPGKKMAERSAKKKEVASVEDEAPEVSPT